MKHGDGLTPAQTVLLVLMAAAGICLRVSAIGRSYWFDELATVTNVDVKDWMTVLEVTSHDNQPPLYNLVVYAWMKAMGRGEIAVRSLSLLISLATLATPWLARTSLARAERLLAFAILCLLSLPIRYAQEARNYGLLLLFSSTCLFAYYELLTRPARRLWMLFYAALTLLAFTHLFGLLLAMCFLAVIFLRTPRWSARLAIAAAGAALAAAVMVPLLRGGAAQIAGGNFWITFTALTLARQLLIVFTPVGLLFIAYAFVEWRRARASAPVDWRLVQALAPFAMMFAGAVVISLHTPILTDRNLIGLVAAVALLVARLLRQPLDQGRVAPSLVLLALLLVQAAALVFTGTLFIREDFRAIAERSIADDQRVCYVVPNGRAESWQGVSRFYVTGIFKRPDLEPRTFDVAAVPQQPGGAACRYWADAHPEGPVSFLTSLPQFKQCSPVGLPTAQYRTHSVLVDCPR